VDHSGRGESIALLGWNDLKQHITITDTTVECPVRGCGRLVQRQHKTFRTETRYRCPDHAIFISPSTFEYAEASVNMLWAGAEDRTLWEQITQSGMKRESRIARDNSEDAVTWNVFRHLERRRLLGRFITEVGGHPSKGTAHLIYWSWCQQTRRAWEPLVTKAVEFGEAKDRRSEPDLIIEDDETLLFIESKLLSGNRTVPSDPSNPKKYETGIRGWFATVFRTSATFQSVAVDAKLYELMRHWLIGSRIANEAGKRFVLVNLVRAAAKTESCIHDRFGAHALLDSDSRDFVRLTWERIRDLVVLSEPPNPDKNKFLAYFRAKTVGYMNGSLHRAFGT
jgi:hypothetical protein